MRKSILLLIIMSCFCLIGQALTSADAKRLYEQKDYIGAAKAYEQLLKDTTLVPSKQASLYYNYASCQYRLHNYAQAVWGYQSALRINPSDGDAAFNLQLTQSKLQDQFDEPSEIFFFTWTRTLIRHFSATTWGITAVILLFVMLVFVTAVKLSSHLGLRKICFGTSIALFAISIVCLLFAYTEANHSFAERQAVTMQPMKVYDSPTLSAKALRELHEGVLIDIIESQPDGWMQVQLPDGSLCWTNNKNYKAISSK